MSLVRLIMGYGDDSYLQEKDDADWIEEIPVYGRVRFRTFKRTRDPGNIRDFVRQLSAWSASPEGQVTGWAICVHIQNLVRAKQYIADEFAPKGGRVDAVSGSFTADQSVLLDWIAARIKRRLAPISGRELDSRSADYLHLPPITPELPVLTFPYPRVYSLIIAIDDYEMLRPASVFNRTSAIRGARMLEDQLRAAVPSVSSRLLLGPDATWQKIQSIGIGQHLVQARPCDLVIVYFAGRAVTRQLPANQKRGYLLTADAQVADGTAEINWFSVHTIDELMRSIANDPYPDVKAHHIFLIIDAAVDGVSGKTPSVLPPPDPNSFMRRQTRHVFIAAKEGENLHEAQGPSQLSMFTGHLLDALQHPERFLISTPAARTATQVGAVITDNIERATLHHQNPQYLEHSMGEERLPSGGDVLVFAKPVYPEMIPIPGSLMFLGSKSGDPYATDPFEQPQELVHVRSFWISRTLVTVEQYWMFIRQTHHTVPYVQAPWAYPYNWDAETRTPPMQYLDHPIILLSEEDIAAYCAWLTKQWAEFLAPGLQFRLPTEAEWEYAARGTNGAVWSWGNTWENGRCNSLEAAVGGPTSVYAFPPQGPFQLHDAVGNVWQRCCTYYAPFPFRLDEHIAPLDTFGKQHVLKGGACNLDKSIVRCATRLLPLANPMFRFIGFRLVLGLPPEYSLIPSAAVSVTNTTSF